MTTPFVPCGWTPNLTACSSGPCCPDLELPANAALVQLAQDTAVAILYRLTGRRFGCCPLTVRPCKPLTCDPLTLSQLIYWDQRYPGFPNNNLGVLSYSPTLIGGEVFNISCGCPTGCCKCRADCEVRLPGPVCSITQVNIAGVTLDPSAYTVYDNRTLVFLNGENCPDCQNYNLDLGHPGTWSVTYTIGVPVPPELNLAAGLYACELAKSFVNDKSCALPARVQQVARQGVSVSFIDPATLATEGLTGIPLVDQIIKAINPTGLRADSRVWYPGVNNRARREIGK